jgi:hypothetical protein
VDLRGANPPEALVAVHGLLDRGSVLDALRSGFPLYLEYHVMLRQPRPFRDRTVADLAWEYVVLYDPVSERFTVETPEGTESLPGPDALGERLARVYALTLDPDDAGEHYYAAEVTAQMLTDQDVDEAFAWLRGDDEDSARVRSPGFLGRLARNLVVQVAPLPRIRLAGRSRPFAVR